MRNLISLILLMLLLVACGSNNEQPPESEFTTGLKLNQTIDILEEQRNYHLYLPENPKIAKMIFLLHGNRGSSDQILGLDGTVSPHKIWIEIAQRENLMLVIPNGSVGSEGHQGWNDCRNDAPTNPNTDDVLFIDNLIDTISNKYQRTDNKAFMVGTSNGGLMSMRLADEIPNKLHAFASVVASRPVNSECMQSSVPISALFMNGTDDPILPYDGGQINPNRGELYSTLDAVAYWVNRNQTNTSVSLVELEDINTNDDSVVRIYSYKDGLNNTRVKHYEVVGGGHTEPSIVERFGLIWKLIVGEQNNDIETAEEIWSYFESL